MTPIRGPRVSLTPLAVDEVSPAYVDWLNDPQTNAYLESRFVIQTLESVRAFVAACAADPLTRLMAIRLNGDGRHIGNVKVGPLDPHHLTAAVGYLVGEPSVRGQGLAREAVGLACRHSGFGDLGARRLFAGVYAPNRASARVLEAVGFRQEGVRRAHARLGEARCDVIEYGLLLDELVDQA